MSKLLEDSFSSIGLKPYRQRFSPWIVGLIALLIGSHVLLAILGVEVPEALDEYGRLVWYAAGYGTARQFRPILK